MSYKDIISNVNAKIRRAANSVVIGNVPVFLEGVLSLVVFGCFMALAYGIFTATTFFGFMFIKAIFCKIAQVGMWAIIGLFVVGYWKYRRRAPVVEILPKDHE